MLGMATHAAVENSKSLTLTFLRKGQRQTVELVPAERPAVIPELTSRLQMDANAEWTMLEYALQESGAVPNVQQDGTRLYYVMPGFVLPDGDNGFPKDLEISVIRKADKPVAITVTRGEQRWDVDEKSLDKLPDDIRPHLERMFGRRRERQHRTTRRRLVGRSRITCRIQRGPRASQPETERVLLGPATDAAQT